MRKILTLLIFIFFAKFYTQQYVPLLQEGNKWYEYNEYYSDGLGEISLTSISIDGEETKNGIVYKKLISNLYSKCLNRYAYPTGCSLTGNPDVFYKLLRETVEERKVYYYDETTNSEVLLYDFSLNIGDEIPYNFPLSAANAEHDPNYIWIINNIIHNGKVFDKTISKTFTKNNSYPNSNNLYEGVGSNLGLLYPPGRPIFEGGNWLVCFENTASGKSCESSFLSSKEILNPEKISVVYSKNSNSFKVVGKSSEKFQATFYDFSGKLLATKMVKSNEDFYINTGSQHGVFIYKLTSSSGVFTGKIIVP